MRHANPLDHAQATRRRFLRQSAGFTAATVTFGQAFPALSRGAASERIVAGVMGTSRNSVGGDGRGTHLAATLATLPGVEVAYVCDVDERNVGKAIDAVGQHQSPPPKGVRDFRKILDDRAVDALVIAAPDHWHAPAAILACAAGKHVYVEKPCCHDAREGELLAAAARKHARVVQHGTQRRTWPALREAIERLRSGDIGRVISAKCFYYSDRPTIGRGKEAVVPQWLDWPLWQGPAPARSFRDNVVHYNWHWFWHWGTGELGNNGVHTIDVARWGFGVDYPLRVSSRGGKYRFDDDQETPDTNAVSFEFDGKLLTWESRSWSARTPIDPDYDVLFAGERGLLAIRGAAYRLYDLAGKPGAGRSANGGDVTHLQNFVDAVRGRGSLNAEIAEGVKSALLCHLGNISYRTGRMLQVDPNTHGIAGDPEATALLSRSYQPGWEPTV